MFKVSLCVVMWLIVLAPGLLFARRHLVTLSAASQVVVGASASVALLIWTGLVETRLLGVAAVTPALWAALTAWSIYDNRDLLRVDRWREADATFGASPELQGLAALVVGSALVRVIPLPFSPLPPGYDPTPHLLLAKLILTNNAIPQTWMPFEPVQLNYAVGIPNLLALLHKITSLGFTLLWRSLYPLFGVIATLAAYSFARMATLKVSTALWIAASYSVFVNMGSLEIYGWGGVINHGAWCLTLALLVLVTELTISASFTWKAHLLAGLFVAAVCLSHLHVMLSMGVVCLAVIAVGRWRFRDRGLHRALLIALALGALLGAFQLVPLALKVTQVRRTGTFTYLEPFYGASQLVRSLGVIFPVATLFGMKRFLRHRGELGGAVLAACLLSLLGVFAALEYGYQGAHYLMTGQRVQPFVPARFLTNSVVFMAAPVGMFLEDAFLWARARGRWLGAVLIAALSLQTAYHVKLLCQNVVDDDEYRSLVWIRDHTPPDAFIINDRGSRWVNFFCWRETSFTPLSASEPVSEHREEKLNAALGLGRRVYLMGYVRGARPVFAAGFFSLYRITRQRPAPQPQRAP